MRRRANLAFFELKDIRFKLKTIENTYQIAEKFFAQRDEEKKRYYIGKSSNHRGYVPFSEKGDYPDEKDRSYEAFDLGLDLPKNDPDYLAGNRLLGPNIWPETQGFRDIVSQYYSEISAVGQHIIACLELYLELPKGAMTRQMTKPISQLRLLHYVRNQNTIDEKSVNMGAHTDYECLTLLHTRNEGLQVMSSDDKWIDVPAHPDVFVVNIGDMMEAWTNGLLRSTPHRVLNLKAERFSMPYFVAANYHAVIKPFSQLISDTRPEKYTPFYAGDHLEKMLIRDFPYLRDKNHYVSRNNDPSQKTVTTNPFEKRLLQETA